MTSVMSNTERPEPHSTNTDAHLAEFELVLGPRQFASLGLVVLTALGVAAGVAYTAGKSVGKVVEVRAPFIPPIVEPAARELPIAEPVRSSEPPIEGIPEPDRTYIQLGSLDRGFATMMAQGARKMGLPAFVAPGASPSVFRVLAGPFPDPSEMEKAQAMFHAIGLKTFVRKFPEFKVSLPARGRL